MVIVIDFDGTLCELNYPAIGLPRHDVIEKVKEAKRRGNTITLNTCREGLLLRDALFWLEYYWGIIPDYVNQNTKENIAEYGDCRKISGDLIVDDKAPGSIEFFLDCSLPWVNKVYEGGYHVA